MSLFKQITLIMSLFLAFIFINVIYFNFQSAKQYAQEEMSNNAQNTATYLSLSLAGAKGNVAQMSTIINAIYDSGYFQEILLTDIQEKVIYQRKKEEKKLEVPQWFLSLYDFQTPLAKATVSSGWNPIGNIQVIPVQDSAHEKLYKNFIKMLQSFILIALVSFSILYVLLHLILSSLVKVTEQAEAVSANNFIINEKIPKTSEFKEVTLAMNKMVQTVKTIFEREASSVKDYHKLLYTDPLTGLHNRNFLELKLNDYTFSQEADANGCILSVFFDGLFEANKIIGNTKVDAFIQDLARIIQAQANTKPQTLIARMDGTKICIVFPETHPDEITDLCETILTLCLVGLEKSTLSDSETSIKLLLSDYHAKDKVKKLLNTIQKSFQKAQKNGITNICLQETLENDLERELIENRIKEHSIALALQDVFDTKGDILHSEAYVRLFDEDKVIHEAGSFIPLVHKMKLDTKLDQNVINYAINEPKLDYRDIAINISLRFLQSEESLKWLQERLAGLQADKKFNFEISNHNIVKALNEGLNFSSILTQTGHNFGIDRFSIEDETNLNYLQMLKPAYLKIDAQYLKDMLQGEQGQTNNALQNLIESLNIKIIATNIENEAIKTELESAGVLYFQGSYLCKPKLV